MAIWSVGDAFCDIIAGDVERMPTWGTNTMAGPIQTSPGGSALNTAANLARLLAEDGCADTDGARSMLYTAVGQDTFGEMLCAHLKTVGAGVMHAGDVGMEGYPTGCCIVLSGKEDRG
jgi:sugar/nucleoside kinase (ribokinase family)